MKHIGNKQFQSFLFSTTISSLLLAVILIGPSISFAATTFPQSAEMAGRGGVISGFPDSGFASSIAPSLMPLNKNRLVAVANGALYYSGTIVDDSINSYSASAEYLMAPLGFGLIVDSVTSGFFNDLFIGAGVGYSYRSFSVGAGFNLKSLMITDVKDVIKQYSLVGSAAFKRSWLILSCEALLHDVNLSEKNIEFVFGGSCMFDNLKVGMDNSIQYGKHGFRGGVEYSIKETLVLRAGGGFTDLSLGFGIQPMKLLIVDYAVVNNYELGLSQFLNIKIRL